MSEMGQINWSKQRNWQKGGKLAKEAIAQLHEERKIFYSGIFKTNERYLKRKMIAHTDQLTEVEEASHG